jgi:hypothetical protein
MKTIELDGNSFGNLDTFMMRSNESCVPDSKVSVETLSAFNDVLRGGFGLFEYDEPIS